MTKDCTLTQVIFAAFSDLPAVNFHWRTIHWRAIPIQTHYSDLSKWSKAHLLVDCPREAFVAFVEWVLVCNESPFTICSGQEDIASPTPCPETSQVCVPATTAVPVGLLVEFESMEWSPAHTTTVEVMLDLVFVDIYCINDFKEDVSIFPLSPL